MFRTNFFRASFLLLAALNCGAAVSATPANPAETPNVVGEVSERLLYDLVNTPVNTTSNVTDNVLGTAVRGSVTTRGQVFPLLVPNAEQGVLQLRFTGTSLSPSLVGRNGPATIYSSSVTNSNLWKTVLFNDQGIRDLPTDGNAQTRVNINDVSAKRPLVEIIARRRANGSRSQAQAITSRKTKGQIAREIDRGAKEPLATAHDYFVHSFREPLLERGALPKLLRFSTTGDHLRLVMRQLGRSPQPSPTNMPELNSKHDLALNLHESSLNSLYEVFYAGETVRDKDFLQAMDTLTGDEPAELRIKAKTPRWSVTLAAERPLELTFADGGAAIVLHITSLKVGERKLDGKFRISVRYQLEKTLGGPQLNRQTEVQADGEIENGTPVERDEALAFLQTKFSGVFLPVLTLDGLALAADDLVSKLSKLVLVQLDAKDGWLVVGYRLPRPIAPTTNRQIASQPTVAYQAANSQTTSYQLISPPTASSQTARYLTRDQQPTSYRPVKLTGSSARRSKCH